MQITETIEALVKLISRRALIATAPSTANQAKATHGKKFMN
jgi:hypothetical protein